MTRDTAPKRKANAMFGDDGRPIVVDRQRIEALERRCALLEAALDEIARAWQAAVSGHPGREPLNDRCSGALAACYGTFAEQVIDMNGADMHCSTCGKDSETAECQACTQWWADNPPTGEITDGWLASVGFKYREPDERQSFRHWTLTFNQHDDDGLYIETTAPGWFNRHGDHINADGGWFLWIGRKHHHLHLRHVWDRSEIIAIVEAIIGQRWVPSRMGFVQVKRK